MYPIITFPCCRIVGMKGQAVSQRKGVVSFKATMGQDGAILPFNAFDETAQLIESLDMDSGSLFTATCAITHYVDSKGIERDSYKIISIQKLQQGSGAYPTVFFQSVIIRKIADGTSARGASYKTLVAEEQIPVKGRNPVRIFNAWDTAIKSIEQLKLKPGYPVSIVAQMRTFFDKKDNKLQTSYKVLSISYLPKRDEKKEPKEDMAANIAIPEPVMEDAPPRENEHADEQNAGAKTVQIPEFQVSEFDALFA